MSLISDEHLTLLFIGAAVTTFLPVHLLYQHLLHSTTNSSTKHNFFLTCFVILCLRFVIMMSAVVYNYASGGWQRMGGKRATFGNRQNAWIYFLKLNTV